MLEVALSRTPNRTATAFVDAGDTGMGFNVALVCHWAGELSLNDYVRGHKAFIQVAALKPPDIGNI
jgi:hypothetical protein